MAPAIESPGHPVIERDDGKFSIGFHDNAPGTFPSRSFAQAVASRQAVPA
jgi:hypothetical protein